MSRSARISIALCAAAEPAVALCAALPLPPGSDAAPPDWIHLLPAGETADGSAVLVAVQALADPARSVPAAAVTALQAELTSLKTGIAREKAEAFVDAAIRAGKITAPATMRDHYIARHMADPAAVEKEIGVMIALNGRSGATGAAPRLDPGGKGELDADEAHLVALMGIDPVAYGKTRAAHAAREEAL